jgi:ketosteroid isomerase-like protein
MSQEDVDLVRRGFEHFLANGDLLEETTDPDFVWDMSTFHNWPDQQVYEGIDGARTFLRDWTEAWDDWKLEVEEYLDAGDGDVLVILRQSGTAKTSGLRVDMHFAQLFTVVDGKQNRMRMYASREEGLEAAGIRR